MPLEINVEEFCLFKANAAKLSNGHNAKRCPQCQALRRLTIIVNNETLDMIIKVFRATSPTVKLDPQEYANKIEALKTVQ